MAEMIGRLSAVFAGVGLQTNLNADAVIESIVRRYGCERKGVTLQERHIGRAFQEVLFDRIKSEQRGEFLSKLFGEDWTGSSDEAVGIQGEIRSQFLKAGKEAYVVESFVDFEQAYELILELGGIPCYPVLADGAAVVCEYERPVEKLIEALKENKIYMTELIPGRNQGKTLSHYVRAIRDAGIAVVSGTEHNTPELGPMEPSCAGQKTVPQEIKEIFVEGAYVVAAHQFLRIHGEQGYVDERGNPGGSYETAEERIRAFARLGAAVVQKYYDINL